MTDADAEKKLAELEVRVKQAETGLENDRRKALETVEEFKGERATWDEVHTKALESVKALENEVREKNEQILQLTKDADFGKRFRELMAATNPSVSTGATGNVKLGAVKWQVTVEEQVRKAEASDTTTCRGRLLKLGKDGFFERHRAFGEIMDEFPRRGWADSDKTISNTLTALFNDGLIAKDRPSEKKALEYYRPDSVAYA